MSEPCAHLLGGIGPLACTETGEHQTHVFVSSSASHLGEGAGHGREADE